MTKIAFSVQNLYKDYIFKHFTRFVLWFLGYVSIVGWDVMVGGGQMGSVFPTAKVRWCLSSWNHPFDDPMRRSKTVVPAPV